MLLITIVDKPQIYIYICILFFKVLFIWKYIKIIFFIFNNNTLKQYIFILSILTRERVAELA